MRSYDLAIIGSGPGGYVAALYASHLNLKVCVIEKDLLGGTCLNRGCIPTKVMLHSAALLSEIRTASSFGIKVSDPAVDFAKVQARKDEVVNRLRTGIETLFRARHVDLIKGPACLKDPHTIKVGSEEISASSIIIATGSRPATLPCIQCDERNVYTSDGVLLVRDVPASMAIIGGGAIGCEFATAFNAFGSKVTVIELLDRLIPMQSREASKKLEQVFKKRGVEVLTSTRVESVAADGKVKIKISGDRIIEVEKALLSIGRIANIEGLGLEDAGIAVDAGRISVDKSLRTSVKNIFAIGDCVEGPLLAHKASYDGILACDVIAGNARTKDYDNIPSCIYTDPEIASVGFNEEEARRACPDAKVAKFPYLASGKAYLMGKTEGFIKIIGDSESRLLGIEIFGHEATDLIGEASLAKAVGINIKDLSHVVHGHPTLSEIFQEASHIFCGRGIHSI